VQVSSSTPGAVVAQSLVYIFECDSNQVQTAYMTRLNSPGQVSQIGTGNTFFQMDNNLRTISTTTGSTNIDFGITSFTGAFGSGSFVLAPGSTNRTDLSDNPAVGFADDNYGILEMDSNLGGEFVSEVLRIREKVEGGQVRYDFVTPTPVR